MKKEASWLAMTYLILWCISLYIFYIIWTSDDGIGFSLIFLYILMPLATVVLSFIAGRKDIFGKKIWMWVLAMGIMYMLSEYFTFSIANTMAFHKVNMPEWGMIPAGIILSIIGVIIGKIVRKRKTQ